MKFKFTKTLLTLIIMLFVGNAQAKQILIYGDSLSAAYGMDLQDGWVQLLQDKWQGQHTITNASISGETTHGGVQRLANTLEQVKPDVVFIELGANDGMQGYPVSRIRANLQEMVAMSQQAGARVVLAGITIPATYGPRYIDEFRNMFIEVARESDIPYIDLYDPEFIVKEGYLQADGLHPTQKTQALIRDKIADFFNAQALLD